jgi:20S proteasome alpha/beta subunit
MSCNKQRSPGIWCFEASYDLSLILPSGVRPYGVSLLVAGYDTNRGPSLYQVDPSGSFWAWKASAIGKNMVNAKTFLEKRCVYLVSTFAGRA